MRNPLAVVVLAVCWGFALVGCSEREKAGDSLMFTANGDPIEFPKDTYVWCGPLEPRDKREAVHVVVSRGGERRLPLWEFHALTGKVKPGATIPFGGDQDVANLFVAADETEAATYELDGEKGTLGIKQLDCNGELELSAKGTLGNEVGPDVIKVDGTFRAKVGDDVPPAFADSD
jgi:hypothetical protein